MNHRIRDPRDVITARFQLEAEHLAPPSATGGQLRAIELGTLSNDDSALYRRTQTADDKAIRFADAVTLMSGLTDVELEVCRLRYWVPLDGHDVYERTVRESELILEVVGEGRNAPQLLMTRDGDEYMRPSVEIQRCVVESETEERQHVEQAVAVEGHAIVRVTRARLTSHETIAERLGITARQVRRVLSAALGKIRERCLRARSEQA